MNFFFCLLFSLSLYRLGRPGVSVQVRHDPVVDTAATSNASGEQRGGGDRASGGGERGSNAGLSTGPVNHHSATAGSRAEGAVASGSTGVSTGGNATGNSFAPGSSTGHPPVRRHVTQKSAKTDGSFFVFVFVS